MFATNLKPEDPCDASLLAPADDYLARVWRTPLEIGDDGKCAAWRAKPRSRDRVCDLAGSAVAKRQDAPTC